MTIFFWSHYRRMSRCYARGTFFFVFHEWTHPREKKGLDRLPSLRVLGETLEYNGRGKCSHAETVKEVYFANKTGPCCAYWNNKECPRDPRTKWRQILSSGDLELESPGSKRTMEREAKNSIFNNINTDIQVHHSGSKKSLYVDRIPNVHWSALSFHFATMDLSSGYCALWVFGHFDTWRYTILLSSSFSLFHSKIQKSVHTSSIDQGDEFDRVTPTEARTRNFPLPCRSTIDKSS